MKGEADILYRNEGNGTFSDVTQAANVVDHQKLYGLGVIGGDYDNDGDPDIYVANDTGPNFLYQNNADGTFTEVGWMVGAAYGAGGEVAGGAWALLLGITIMMDTTTYWSPTSGNRPIPFITTMRVNFFRISASMPE